MKTKLLRRLRKQISIYYYPNFKEKFFLVKKPTPYQSIVNFWKFDAFGYMPYPEVNKSFKSLVDAKDWIVVYAILNYKAYSRKAKLDKLKAQESNNKLLIRFKVWHNKI